MAQSILGGKMKTVAVIKVEEPEVSLDLDGMKEVIEHDLADSKQLHDAVVEEIGDWIDEYNGEPYGNEVEGRSSLVWKLIMKQGEALISNLVKPFLGNFDIVNMDPMTEADVYKTKIAEKLTNHYWNKEFKPVRFLKTLGRVNVMEGTVFVRVGWNRETKERKETIPLEAITEQMREQLGSKGAEFVENTDGTVTITVTKILSNHPTAKVVRGENVYIDPTADLFEELKFLIYEDVSSLGEISNDPIYDEEAVKRFRSLIRENDDKKYDQEIHPYNPTDFEFLDESRKKIRLYEYWGKYDLYNDGKDVPVVAVMAKYGENNMVIRMEENPFPFKKIPFVCIPFYEDPFSVHGRALAAVISDEQKLSTSIVRGIIDNMSNSNNGVKFFKKNALDIVNLNRLKRGDKIVEINTQDSINTAVMDGTFNQLPQYIFGMLSMMDQQAEALTGVSKAMQGIPGSEIKASSSNFSAMMTQSQVRLLDVTTNITNGLKEMIEMWVAMMTQYVDDSEVKRITGIDIPALKQQETQRLAQQFGLDQLPPDTAMKAMVMVANEVEDMFDKSDFKYDLKIKVGTDGLKQIKIQNILMLMQQIGGLMESGTIPPDALKLLLADLADQLDRPDIAQMITEYQPQPNPMAQKAAELELQKKSAEVKKDEALAANAMARTQNVASKTKKDTIMTDADMANKYADVAKKMAEVDQGDTETLIKAHEAGTKRKQSQQKTGGEK